MRGTTIIVIIAAFLLLSGAMVVAYQLYQPETSDVKTPIREAEIVPSGGKTPPSPISIDIFFPDEVSEPLSLNQTFNLTWAMTPHGNIRNVEAGINLPGFVVLSGNTTWNGDLKKNKPIEHILTVKAIKTGEWTLTSNAYSFPKSESDETTPGLALGNCARTTLITGDHPSGWSGDFKLIAAYSPVFTVDSDTNLHIVYSKPYSSGPVVYQAQPLDFIYTTVNSNGKIIDQKEFCTNSTMHYSKHMVADSDENLHLIWIDYGHFNSSRSHHEGTIMYTKLDSTGNVIISDKKLDIGTSRFLDIAIDSLNNIHIVYSKFTDVKFNAFAYCTEVYYLKVDNYGNVLGEPIRLSGPIVPCETHIAIDSSDNVHITTWEEVEPVQHRWINKEVHYIKMDNSGQVLVDIRIPNAGNSKIITDSEDNAYLFWINSGIRFVKIENDRFQYVNTTCNPPSQYCDFTTLDVEIDSKDIMHVVATCYSTASFNIYSPHITYVSINKNGTPVQNLIELSRDDFIAVRPQIKVEDNDNIHIIFINQNVVDAPGFVYYKNAICETAKSRGRLVKIAEALRRQPR